MLSLALLAAAAMTTDVNQAPQLFGAGVISIPVRATGPTFTPDGQLVIYERDTSATRELVQSKRSGDKWLPPEPLPTDSRYTAIEPALAPDGSYLLFASNRPVTGATPLDGNWGGSKWPKRGGAIWRMDRTATGWSEPYPLPSTVNTNPSTFEPATTTSGRLYFMRADADGEFHIYCAEPDGKGYREAQPLSFTKRGIGDIDPAVAADESFMIFGSNRGTGGSNNRLFISFRSGGKWSEPTLLSGTFNTGDIIEPRLGNGGQTLYYSQNRAIWSVQLQPILQAARSDRARG